MFKKIFVFLAVMLIAGLSWADGPVEGDLAEYMQNVSVTIKSGLSQGSGVLITRELRVSDDNDATQKVNFVWTAAHVIDNLRKTREVITNDGQKKTLIEFKDAKITKQLIEQGRKVGEINMDAKVIKFSDADNGRDLALLMVRKRDFVDANTIFHTDGPGIVPVGTSLLHCGSLLGVTGANSVTSGIMSQVGRVLEIGNGPGKVFDQTTAPGFPGSSGGGVFFAEHPDHRGELVGFLVRGAGETFNLIVPVREVISWSKENNVEWAVTQKMAMPTLNEIEKLPIEDTK